MVHAVVLSRVTRACYQTVVRFECLDIINRNCDWECVALNQCDSIFNAVTVADAVKYRELIRDRLPVSVRLSRCFCHVFKDAVVYF